MDAAFEFFIRASVAVIYWFVLTHFIGGDPKRSPKINGHRLASALSAMPFVTITHRYNQSDVDYYAAVAINILLFYLSGFVIGYFWRRYKIKAAVPNTTLNSPSQTAVRLSSESNSEETWAVASQELNSTSRKEGLWAKCFAEASGDENRAKAEYLKQRVTQLVAAAHEDFSKQEALAALAVLENVSTKIASQHENSENESNVLSQSVAHPIIADGSQTDNDWGWTIFWILVFIVLIVWVLSFYW
ncbi:hypothetical protein MCERE10_02568 [Burkholderiaceae bacterium]